MNPKSLSHKMLCLSLAFVVFCLIFGGGKTLFAEEAAPSSQLVRVDLSSKKGVMTHRGSGFLHGMSLKSPDDSLLIPIRPKLFRNAAHGQYGAIEVYPRIKRFGAISQIVVSDTYGYQKDDFPGDGSSYWRLEEVINRLLSETKERGQKHQWDIWNEPDLKSFWPRSRSQFFETWKRAVKQIRREDPFHEIVGPSINAYKESYLKEFLQFAKREDVLPDILSWHEISGKNPPKITQHVDEMRTFLRENDFEIDRIQINEHTSIGLKFEPGATVWFLSQLEYAEVDGAAKACWRDGNQSNCQTGTLDGIVTLGGMPRPIWWVYKGYGDLSGTRVEVKGTSRVSGIAAFDRARKKLDVLLGAMDAKGGVEIKIENLSEFFPKRSQNLFEVRAGLIPYVNKGRSELVALPQTIHAVYEAERDELLLALPDFEANDAYVLEIKRPDVPVVGPAHQAMN